MPKYRSATTTHGRNMAGARALWRATGMTDADFGKPIIAVVNSNLVRDRRSRLPTFIATWVIVLPSREAVWWSTKRAIVQGACARPLPERASAALRMSDRR